MSGTLVLDTDGLVKLAAGDPRARAYLAEARTRRARVTTSAVTLTEVLRGGPRNAAVHRVLGRIAVIPVSAELARRAGDLLVSAGMSSRNHAVDAIVATTALALERPVVLLTSDPEGMARLTNEPGLPQAERITVVGV
jgi:predicted nucleic acid-binding protein